MTIYLIPLRNDQMNLSFNKDLFRVYANLLSILMINNQCSHKSALYLLIFNKP